MKRGLEKGIQQGIEQGREEGVQIGMNQTLTVLDLLREGKSADQIAISTGLRLEQIQEIKKHVH